MWDSLQGRAVETPPAVVSKVNRIFAMFAAALQPDVSFRYAGTAARAYSGVGEIPEDGTIYIVLNGDYPFVPVKEGGPGGVGGFRGAIPHDFRGGYVFVSTRAGGLFTLTTGVLAHEIGHVLGLGHAATNSSTMFCGSMAWGAQEYFHLSEQDRLNLRRLWARDTRTYVLSGAVAGALPYGGGYGVYVVSTKNGHTFSALTGARGGNRHAYEVVLGGPGQYRVVAVAYPWDATGAAREGASWYVRGGEAVNDPQGGSVVDVAPSQTTTSGIDITMVAGPAPFNLFWSNPFDALSPTGAPTFLQPGGSASFYLMYPHGSIESITPYGASPDIAITRQRRGSQTYSIWLDAQADAEAGDRLILGQGGPGQLVHAGLVGIHVVTRVPDIVPIDQRCRSMDDWVRYQIENGTDFGAFSGDF
jgi:hypothetical protein